MIRAIIAKCTTVETFGNCYKTFPFSGFSNIARVFFADPNVDFLVLVGVRGRANFLGVEESA